VQPGLPPVFEQETLVAQVIENLSATPTRTALGTLLSKWSADPTTSGQIELSIRNHGMGLSESETEDVFTAFYRSRKLSKPLLEWASASRAASETTD
jgi:signal transduction histidine kinase